MANVNTRQAADPTPPADAPPESLAGNVTTAVTAPSAAPRDQGIVTVTLAHHLSGERLQALMPEMGPDGHLSPLDKLEVSPEVARSLATAGYVLGVEVDDSDAINKAASPS